MGHDREAAIAAFKAYDWDGSADFKAHLRNVELPGGAGEAAPALAKVKAKWFKKAVDPDFDVSWVSPPAASSSSQQQQQQQQPAAAAAAAARTQPSAQQRQQPSAAGRSAAWQAGRNLHTGILQALILMLALPAVVSPWAYRKLTLVLLASQALQLHTKLGGPGAWSRGALQAWLARALACSEGQLLSLALLASINRPIAAVLPPFVLLAAFRLVALLDGALAGNAHWRSMYGARLAGMMAARRADAALLAAQGEIVLFFTLVLGLLTPGRAPMFVFGTAQFLRMRFWSADVGAQHRAVWSSMDAATAGFRQRFPLLERVVQFGVQFFHQQQTHARTA